VNLVRIEGDPEAALGLRDLADAIVVWSSVDQLEGGRVSVAAYATERAMTEIEGRGFGVTVIVDEESLQARLAELRESSAREGGDDDDERESPLVG
jgi:hypothetical protein